MDSNVISALISGVFSVISAFGAVYLKELLDARTSQAQKVAKEPVSHEIQSINSEVIQSEPINNKIRKRHIFLRPIFIVGGSFLFGLATRAMRPLFTGSTHWETLIALVVLLLIVFAISIFHRRNGHQLGFQLENIAMWTGWASGWSLIHGSIWGDLLGLAIPWWFGCALVGGILVSFHRKS